jgi:predicted PolB exonuclease-like 3'-5' exonuclease
MLAFDLETTGLDPRTNTITCACVCDPERNFERAFMFHMGDDPEEFMRLLDDADRLCAFNGAQFDIPFLECAFRVEPRRVIAWRMKLHDVYEACRLALDVTFPLQDMLELNGIPGKTGSGEDAVRLAASGQWDQLRAYCLDDARKTHHVSSLARIRLPCTRGMIHMDPAGHFHVASDLHRIS